MIDSAKEQAGLTTIAFICDDLMTGGWSTLISVVKSLDRKRFTPLVICLFGEGKYADELKQAGIEVIYLHLTKFNLIPRLISLRNILASRQVAIVHTQLNLSHMVGQTAALLAGVPIRLIQFHSLAPPPTGLRGWWLRQVIKRSHAAIAVSEAAATTFREDHGKDEPPVHVVHNAISTKLYVSPDASSSLHAELSLPDDAVILLTVANLKPEKGIATLLRAAQTLSNRNLHFVVAGDGPLRQELEHQSSELKTTDMVHFLGYREDIPSLLAQADLFVLPSVQEAFGIALLEAMAARVPIIASDTGGIPEILTHRKSAWLVSPADRDSLTEAIITLIEDKDTRRTLTEEAFRELTRFDIQECVAKYEQVYCQLVNLQSES